jgi:hypothetical protein
VYTQYISQASKRDILQFVITTPEPVIRDTDIIACFPNPKIYIYLRKPFSSTYRILGEAIALLHEVSREPAKLSLRSQFLLPDKPAEFPRKEVALFADFITLWCEEVPNTSEL